MYPVRRQISPHAARLRQDMTDVERKLWYAVRDRRLDGFKFRRQATIGPFVVDFLCIEARLIIELDGGQHEEARDAPRTAFLAAQDYRVIRFWNTDVVQYFEGVLDSIRRALGEGLEKETLTQPSPAKAGEG